MQENISYHSSVTLLNDEMNTHFELYRNGIFNEQRCARDQLVDNKV